MPLRLYPPVTPFFGFPLDGGSSFPTLKLVPLEYILRQVLGLKHAFLQCVASDRARHLRFHTPLTRKGKLPDQMLNGMD